MVGKNGLITEKCVELLDYISGVCERRMRIIFKLKENLIEIKFSFVPSVGAHAGEVTKALIEIIKQDHTNPLFNLDCIGIVNKIYTVQLPLSFLIKIPSGVIIKSFTLTITSPCQSLIEDFYHFVTLSILPYKKNSFKTIKYETH